MFDQSKKVTTKRTNNAVNKYTESLIYSLINKSVANCNRTVFKILKNVSDMSSIEPGNAN